MLTDLHAHSNNSRCADPVASVDAMVRAAAEAGLDGLGITDHLHPNTDSAIFAHNRERLAALEDRGVAVWIGTEADVTTLSGGITGNPELYKSLDYVMGGIHHYHLPWIERPDVARPAEEVMLFAHRNLIHAARNPWLDAIGHPWVGMYGYLRGFDFRYELIRPEWIEELGSEAKAHGTALEIPVWALIGRETIPAEAYIETIVRPLIRTGCSLFSGTDSHHPSGIGAGTADAYRILRENGADDAQLWTPKANR